MRDQTWVNDNIIHFVFVLREDFLSEFEFYTTKIPSLKQHRFALRPLNEEQAAEIIMKPCPGLVSLDVARLIIEMVTNRKDFSLGDEPEIEVDAAVLSLFLSRIYQKLDVKDDVISSRIIKQFGTDIIRDFYVESVEDLNEEELNLIEDKLLTSNGRRNNVSYFDFCKFVNKKKVEDLSSMQSYPVQERFREKYSTRILDALPDMLTVFDHDANIIELASSPSTNHVEGINADNITHSNVKDILPPEAYESVRQNMDRVILTGESSTSRHDLMLDGILHHYENRIFPLDKEYLLCMCRDISEQWNAEQTNKKQQKELEAARIKAEESDRLKSAFLANMSHEIRTPLNAIVGFSKLVIDAECTNEKEQYAEIIERNSEILLNLFNDILDLSSLEADSLSFNIRPIKLIDICLQLEQQFCYKVKNGTKLILDDVDTELYVSGDWNRIIQIISNLLSNAAKFTPKGEIHFGYREKEDFVEFYVKDSGIGIPAERVATIFQRFGKINDFVQGTGLGLTLCRMLVEKMGGRIWLRSQEGKGSRFYFTLPLIRQ